MVDGPEIQMSLADADETGEYRAFLQKFKSKKTKDDCVTPPEVYEAVAGWVAEEYGVDRADFVRPFWPGEDYTRHRYAGRIVVDNPPFSIITRIVKFYAQNGIRFFLFAPSLTLFNSAAPEEVCALAVGVMIRYENGAEVRTSFLTNMDAAKVRTAPGLYRAVADAVERGRKRKPELPVYDLPDNVITAARIQKYAHYGIEFKVQRGQAHFVRSIGAMGEKGLFGAGFLISDKAAADKAAADIAAADKAAAKKAIKYKLNEREREIVRRLGEVRGNDD